METKNINSACGTKSVICRLFFYINQNRKHISINTTAKCLMLTFHLCYSPWSPVCSFTEKTKINIKKMWWTPKYTYFPIHFLFKQPSSCVVLQDSFSPSFTFCVYSLIVFFWFSLLESYFFGLTLPVSRSVETDVDRSFLVQGLQSPTFLQHP